MAKLKAPLMSLGASGALGKSLVFLPWKGLDCVREYVVPSNPNTLAQSTQRGYLRACVTKIHDVQKQAVNPLDSDDVSAYLALGSLRPTPRTWFNEVVKTWLDTKVAGNTPVIYSDGTISSKVVGAFSIILYLNEAVSEDMVAGTFYFGTSKTAMLKAVAATVTAGVSVKLDAEDLDEWMVPGEKYFVQFRPDTADPCEYAVSGIFSFVALPNPP